MKRTKFSKKLRKLTVRSLAALISLTVILSMVTVLGLVSFAADEEQMILLSADTNPNDIIIPIPKSTLSKNEYYKLTFKAKVLKGTKPIVGFLNVKNTGTNASPKYAYQAKPDNVNNASFDGTLDMTGGSPQLYTNYDASNKMFTAIIRVEELKYISNSSDDAHHNIVGLLTIGNTEYVGGDEKNTDTELEFVFARPQLKHMVKVDGVWTTEDDNAIDLPDLKASTIDKSRSYAYTTTGYNKTIIKDGVDVDGKLAFICAPKDIYSTLADDLSKINLIDYNDNLKTSAGHNFIYVPEKEPTTTSTGKKAHYTCDCGECDGKFYESEIESSLVDESELIIPETTEKTIVFEKTNKVSNIAVPLELKKAVESLDDPTVITSGNDNYEVYLKLKFKARMFSGTQPVIGVVGKSSDGVAITHKEYANNANDTSDSLWADLSCNYDPATLEYTAIIKADVKNDVTGKDLVITIGNTEHDGADGYDTVDYDVSFEMTEPELYILDPTTKIEVDNTSNLLNTITDYNTLFDNSKVITSVQGLLGAKTRSYTRDGVNNAVIKRDPIENFFNPNHNFVEVPKEEPTADNDGRRAYYYCKDCTVEGCCFAGKKYSDKGYTEVTDEELVIKKFQMITISPDNNTNVFVPLDLSGVVTEKHLGAGKTKGSVYVKLTFDAKMIEGDKPIVSRIRASSDLGGDYSYSEKDYADNTNETPAPAGQTPVLYSKFDKYTGKYEAVIKLEVGISYYTLSNGVHDAILIGHSEHNGPYYTSETDSSVSFSFANPELYLMDIATGEVDYSTGNLLPSISEGHLNLNENYVHNANPCKADNNILAAPKNKWSVDGDPNNVKVEDITAGYFDYIEFTYHKQQDPTPTTDGVKAHYTCDDPTKTAYYGKKYWDKGITEITDPDNELKITYSKMITIKPGSRSNVFIPLDLTKYSAYKKYKDASGYSYVMLRFKARMLKGEKPVVSRIRGDRTQGEGTYSEPNYVDNFDDIYDGVIENENGDKNVASPDLYCNFNEETGVYTAIIRLGIGVSWSTLSNGVHDAILIGNAEHNGNSYTSESDSNVSFSFTSPELYLVNAATGEADFSTGNLMPPICEENLNKSDVEGQLKSYKHNANPCTASDHILTAPKNKWSTDGDASYVEYSNIEEKYFDYRFVRIDALEPTMTSEGHMAYYECQCGDPLCKYAGKKFSDKGMTEVTDDDIKLGKIKMITVKSGSNDNAYIPLNISDSLKDKYKDEGGYSYLMLTFKARMYEGVKPVVSRVRGDWSKKDSDGNPIEGSHAEKHYVDNDDNEYSGVEPKNDTGSVNGPDLYCKYDETTNIYTAVIRLGVGTSWSTLSNGVHDAILIGHSEHNGPSFTSETDQAVSFSFTQPELYFINIKGDISTEEKLFNAVDKSTGNLIMPICDQTNNLSETYEYTTDPTISARHLLKAPKNMWSIDGKNASGGIYMEEIPEEKYFDHYFKYHEEVRPTYTKAGTKAYYTCVCGNDDCIYKDKKYSDKGITEITDISLGKAKMITIGAGSYDNVYIPLNLKNNLKKEYKDEGGYSYLMLKFRARMYTGVKPIVSRVRGDLTKKDTEGNTLEGSHAEKNYVDNDDNEYGGVESKNDTGSVNGPDLYCKYDDKKNEYTAVIRLGVGVGWSTLSSGIHDAILIGHSEHNGPSFTSETDQAVSFSFADPELYFIDITGDISTEEKLFAAVDTSTGNLIAPICDETNNLSATYEYTTDPTTSAKHLLKAPQDKWSIDGKNSSGSIYMTDIPDSNYFDHFFVYHEEVRPTPTKTGTRAYYTCGCNKDDCIYKGKMYSDKGVTEITNINLGIAKMITVKSGSNDNAYIPLNLKDSLKKEYKDGGGYSYLMLKFKARMYTGVKPIVSRVRGDLTKKDAEGNTLEGSHAEKNYVDNNDDTYDGVEVKDRDKEGNVTATGPDLYCKYDETTNTYTAIIRLGVGVGWSTLANGVHDAILIGHSEHNGPSFTSETDQTASFSFADPELYFIDVTGDISTEEKLFAAVDYTTGNLIAPICDETNNLSSTYEYTTDPTISEKHLLKAPQDKWSIDGKNVGSGIYMESIPDEKYFSHYFVYTPEVRPTPTTGGQRAYYTCVCGAEDCKYAGKKYADKGITELTDISLSKTKMILVSANAASKSAVSNVFVPISLKSVVKDKHKDSGGYSYVKLKFKARILSGSYPIVSRIRGSSDLGGDYSYSEPGYADNGDHTYDGIENKNDKGTVRGPDLYTEYNPDTMIFTAIIRISASSAYTTLSNGVHDAILIGNAEHNGSGISENDYSNAFIFAEPELYLLNASTGEEDLDLGNLMPPICDENINAGKTYAHKDVANIKSGSYTYNPCTLENHILSAPKDRWSVDGDSSLVSYYEIPNGYFESTSEKASKITITNGASGSIISTTAKLQASKDYKVDIDYNAKNGGKLVVDYMMLNGNNEYANAYDLGVTAEKTIDNVEGKHYAAVFTMPASGLLGTKYDNFKLLIGATGGNVEFTNVKVRPISISGVYGHNALLNGDFRRSYESSTEFDKTFPFWNVENASEVSKITSEKGVKAGDFADTIPLAIYAKNTTGIFTTDVSLKPNTEYVFKFGSKYESEEKAKPYVVLRTASGVITEIGKYSNDVDGLHNTVYKFKTPSDLLGGLNATVGVNIDSKNIIASFSGFELYELSELGTEKGENYISDPYLLSFGTASSIWKKSDSLSVTPKQISIYHFKILEPKVLVFSGRNGMDSPVGKDGNVVYAGNSNGYIETFATIEKGKQYIFSLNYKFAGEGYNLGEAKKGPELLVNTANGYVALAANKTVSNDEYKETYIFTAPDGLSESSNNFRFRFNVPGAMTSGYLANVSLRQYNGTKAEGEELIENGNFSTGDISGWSRSSSSHFYQFKFAEIPENFFSKTNPNKPSMIIFREPTDYAQFMQHLMVKPSTNYEIEYEIKHSAQKYDDKPAHFTIYVNDYTRTEDGSGFVLKADGRNVDSSGVAMPSIYKATQKDIDKYADATKRTYHSTVDDNYDQKYRQILRFTTSKNIRTTGDGNILIRLYMRSGTAGFFGQVKLYELDENGKRIGNNLILNGDFSLGLTAWDTTGEFTARTVTQPDGFFDNDYSDTPKTMVYSNGSASNQTYGNTFKLKKGATYYFSGNYVNMNSQGLKPEIKYRSVTGEFKTLQADLYYNADWYYFEIKFQLPEDALFIDGLAEVQVYITNNEKGKGYFHSLRLTEGSSYDNMFDDVGFVGANGNYIVMDYDPNVFVFYYDDTKFNDGDWSGEAELTDSDAKGVVLDELGNGVSGIKMVLDPIGKTSETDDGGDYSFKELKPGTYSLYLVSPKTKKKVFCVSFDVEESQSVTLPIITYSYSKVEDEEDVIEVIGEVESKSRSIIQCLLFDEEGNRLSDIPIFIDDNGYAITNKKGIATFDNLQNFGSKKIYIYLDNGEKYIFRKVDVVEGKGTRIKLMFAQESDNTLLYILIFGGAGLLLAAGAAVTIILLLKKKASVVSP